MRKVMPTAPKFNISLIGPGIVLIAMGLGSGEFILWPSLVAQYGFGILWGALVGITLQYFVSNETGRYTLATGASVYTGFHKLHKWIPFWFILSTYISFAWPGIIGSGGEVIGHLVGIESHQYITVVLLLIIGFLLTVGGEVYNNLERLQKLFIAVAFPVLFLIVVLLINPDIIQNLGQGIVGIGEGYNFLPAGISFMSFIGAVAYSGAGGNLVASHSFYVQDEGLGMAKYANSQVKIGSGSKEVYKGGMFNQSEDEVNQFKKWMRLTSIEQFISFLSLGFITILLLSIISYALVYPFEDGEGLDFIFLQESELGEQFGGLVGTFFLIVGATFLFTTQLGVFETTSRIMSENLKLGAENFAKKFTRSQLFFFFLWAQILFAIFISLLNISEPLEILLLSTFFSAVSMLVLSVLVLALNSSKLVPKVIQPGLPRKAVLLISSIFFTIFVVLTTIDILT